MDFEILGVWVSLGVDAEDNLSTPYGTSLQSLSSIGVDLNEI
jgi:hypothetical protein